MTPTQSEHPISTGEPEAPLASDASGGADTATSPMPPLPSSLAPLPGETLTGFLLRMAYRLDLSPGRIAELTGLLAADARTLQLPFALLMDLTPAQRASLAHTARLTQAEASALCLSSFADRYTPAVPLTGARTGARAWRGARGTGQTRWIYDRIIRWCPQCLIGDGAPIQNQLGGAWQKTWRLAVVFGCPRHHRLLEHLCPTCGRPPGSSGPRVLSLIDAHRTGIHPTHCRLPAPDPDLSRYQRAPACDSPLSTAPVRPSTALTAPYLGLQRRILTLLDPAQPGEILSVTLPASPAQYFTDLQLTSELIRTSWPRICSLTDVPAELVALAEHDHRRAATGKTRRNVYQEPPLEADVSAALFTVADELLQHEPRDLAEHVLHLRNHDPRRSGKMPWARTILFTRPDCSPGFLKALAPTLHPYTRRAGSHSRKAIQNPLYPTGYQPAHIAQFLQDDWYQRYLSHLDGLNPTHLRRTAAVFLCQLAVGGSVTKAAALLDVPAERAHVSSKFVQRWARIRTDPREFESAVHALADHLDQTGRTGHLIDYQQRRRALREWCIGPATWTHIRSQLGPFHPFSSNLQLGDRRRQTASMIVWTRVTQSEHIFAPHPIRDQQPPETWLAWRTTDYAAWARIQHRRLGHLETDLYRILYAYADDLAAQIDSGQRPTID